MESRTPSRLKGVFTGIAAYYLLCGIGGILYPESWVTVAGSREILPDFAIQLVGTVLFGFGIGFLVARSSPLENNGLVVAALFATALDIGAVVVGQREGFISQASAVSFICLDAALVAVFWWILRQRSKAMR